MRLSMAKGVGWFIESPISIAEGASLCAGRARTPLRLDSLLLHEIKKLALVKTMIKDKISWTFVKPTAACQKRHSYRGYHSLHRANVWKSGAIVIQPILPRHRMQCARAHARAHTALLQCLRGDDGPPKQRGPIRLLFL